MPNPEEHQDFDLDDILSEFHQEAPEAPAQEAEEPPAPGTLTEEITRILEDIPKDVLPEVTAADTLRLDDLSGIPEAAAPADAAPLTEEEPEAQEPAGEDYDEYDDEEPPKVIELVPKARLRELKKKLIAGPEKRYYELSEIGLGRVQTAMLLCLAITGLCAAATALFAAGVVPNDRLRLIIFSQVLAMLVSALLGSHQMLDGLTDLLLGRFTVNTMLSITFVSCCVDAVFCLRDLRVPCCGAFSLEMALALWGRYNRRATEMAQMDTLRKAIRLHGLVKQPDFYKKKPGLLRTYGDADHFTQNYQEMSAPEKVQCWYAFLSFLLCIGIALFAGLRHDVPTAFQILSTSLLVAVPASYFISLTRPAAILQTRLHMVGVVLCGWQGVKGLKKKAAFPLKDEDLFPKGSAKLNGVKFYGERLPDEVVSFACSVISAAGGGLAGTFRQLLISRGVREVTVKNLRRYSDGIGGEIGGISVILGSHAFLENMGVEIPQGTMVNQAIYCAIDGELSAVVAISYAKMRSASGGLVSLCGSRKNIPILVGNDFMVTESLIRSRFGVNTRRMVFPDRETRAALNQVEPDPNAVALALSTREDLISFAYAISGARSLCTAASLGNIIHILGGILGMLIMLALTYLGRTDLLTPTHVLLYQLVWLIPALLITEWTRTV